MFYPLNSFAVCRVYWSTKSLNHQHNISYNHENLFEACTILRTACNCHSGFCTAPYRSWNQYRPASPADGENDC